MPKNIYILTAIYNGEYVKNYEEFSFAYTNVEAGFKQLCDVISQLHNTKEVKISCEENYIEGRLDVINGGVLTFDTKCINMYE